MPEEVKRPEWIEADAANGRDNAVYALSLERKIAEIQSSFQSGLNELAVNVIKENVSLRAQAEALAAAAGELSDWLQETGGGLDIVAFNRKANALHKALAAYRAGNTESTAVQKALPTPERLREVAKRIEGLGIIGSETARRDADYLRAFADAMEGKVT